MLPLPEGLSSTDGLWALPPGEDIEHVQLIRWRLSLPDGAGQWILLCRLAGERLLQAARAAIPSSLPCLKSHPAAAACSQFWELVPACMLGTGVLRSVACLLSICWSNDCPLPQLPMPMRVLASVWLPQRLLVSRLPPSLRRGACTGAGATCLHSCGRRPAGSRA